MIKFKNGIQTIIPVGTWERMSVKQRSEYTDGSDGSSDGNVKVVVNKLKAANAPVVQKKTAEVVVPADIRNDDITGNPEPEVKKIVKKIPAKRKKK